MGQRLFFFESYVAHRIEIKWEENWSDITIDLDGENIGEFNKKDFLIKGYKYCANGTTLFFQLVRRFFWYELRVTANGNPAVGVNNSPDSQYKSSYRLILFLAIMDFIMGFCSILFPSEFLGGKFFIELLSIGFVLTVLYYFVYKRSIAALKISLVVVFLNMAFIIIIWDLPEHKIDWIKILLSSSFPLSLYEGVKALKIIRMKGYQSQASNR